MIMKMDFCPILLFILVVFVDKIQVEAFHIQTHTIINDHGDQNNGNEESLSRPPHHRRDEPYRTAYHFQPSKNWMNDPNGPMLYKGIYHLFYQYNPKGVTWGNIVWGHSTSPDLVNWTPQPIAISPSIPSDINGCWTGSATLLPGEKPAIIYTGSNLHHQQVQNLALPKNRSDPYLIKWVKHPRNPLITPTDHINASSFRDPTTAWRLPDGRWRLVVGSKMKNRGMAILYRSRDFVRWVRAKKPLHFADGTGMWECPDFYPVYENRVSRNASSIGKYVLKASLDGTGHEYYTIGRYDAHRDVYVPNEGSIEGGSGLRYDYGKFYASKTFYDGAKGRRVLWGWVNESASVDDDRKKGWSGIQAFPRTVLLDKSGKQLVQWPVEEIEILREKQIEMPRAILKRGSLVEVSDITAAQADVEISFKIKDFTRAEKFDPKWTNPQQLCTMKGASLKGGLGPFGLLILASKNKEEQTAVFFRIFKANHNKFVVLMCSDQSRSSLNPTNDKQSYGSFVQVNPRHQELSLRSLIDHSVVESFGAKGKSCITARVYPTIAIHDKAHLHAFNNGTMSVEITKFRAWNMKKAQIT